MWQRVELTVTKHLEKSATCYRQRVNECARERLASRHVALCILSSALVLSFLSASLSLSGRNTKPCSGSLARWRNFFCLPLLTFANETFLETLSYSLKKSRPDLRSVKFYICSSDNNTILVTIRKSQ